MFTRFRDVDGNTFQLVSLEVVSRAIEAQRRAAAEKREADRRAAFELQIARQVQARLFPQRLPHAATLEYAGLCIQARQVGGDYYDFLSLGRDRRGLVIGDIAGKGMPAALLMANLPANLRSHCAKSRLTLPAGGAASIAIVGPAGESMSRPRRAGATNRVPVITGLVQRDKSHVIASPARTTVSG